MSRAVLKGYQVIVDLLVLSAMYWLAVMLRFEFNPGLTAHKQHLLAWPYVVLLQYGMLALFGVPRFAWRYVGVRETWRVMLALGTAALPLALLRVLVGQTAHYGKYLALPFGILITDALLAFFGIAGVRFLRRALADRADRRTRTWDRHHVLEPTILVGAGTAGVMVAREIDARPDLGIRPIGFVDDDPLKQGTVVGGLRVLGRTGDLAKIAHRHKLRQALITIASARGNDIRRIHRLCDDAKLPTKIIPGIFEIVGGKVNLSRLRAVAIEDLLRRDPVRLDEQRIRGVVAQRAVMVTGAGGSIGSELCRQVARFATRSLILVERSENALFNIHRELKSAFPDVLIHPYVADVSDEIRMDAVFHQAQPDIVFHAAAHKHVPLMEANVCEAIHNNVFGTRTVADLAHRHGISQFVMISTDKAVNPSSVMGVSKRLAEIYVQALSAKSETRFVAVRFGNVLGSAGSVVPIFKEQIARGGPVTITHEDMTRFFMTIPEACQLVLQAASMGGGGEVFILDMGEPVRIVDLANDLIKLSGLVPGEDVEVHVTGVRPGEKLHEELATDDEQADLTDHPKIFTARQRPNGRTSLLQRLDHLRALVDSQNDDAMRVELMALVPEYSGTRPDGLHAPTTERVQPSRPAKPDEARRPIRGTDVVAGQGGAA